MARPVDLVRKSLQKLEGRAGLNQEVFEISLVGSGAGVQTFYGSGRATLARYDTREKRLDPQKAPIYDS